MLEDTAFDLGKKALEKSDIRSSPLSQVIYEHLVPTVASDVHVFKAQRGAGRGLRWKHLVAEVPDDVTAYLLIRASLGILPGSTIQRTSYQLGDTVIREQTYQHFLVEKDTKVKVSDTSFRYHQGRNYWKYQITKAPGVPNEAARDLGLVYLDMMVKHGVLCIKEYKVYLTQYVLDILGRDVDALVRPRYLPLEYPPEPWTNENDGGYRVLKYPLVRRKSHRSPTIPPLPESFLKGINRLQRTPYRVNKEVAEVFKVLFEQGGGVAGLPRHPDIISGMYPPKPVNATRDSFEWKEWRTLYLIWKSSYLHEQGEYQTTMLNYWWVNTMLAYPRFWYTPFLDFRGRVYYNQIYVNPQRGIFTGLLEFADGKEVTDPKWLEISLANNYGVDKISHAEQRAWVNENLDKIRLSVAHPLDYDWWTYADSPFAFLIAAREYLEYLQNGSVISHQILFVDGTCNGTQHMAAMLRDDKGGKYVNLCDADSPQDIYMETLKLMLKQIENDTSPYAAMARRYLNRNVVKRPIMTLPYGLTRFGMQDKIKNTLLEEHGRIQDVKALAAYIQQHLQTAIEELLPSSINLMKWLRKGKKLKDGVQVTFPSGFTMFQQYKQTRYRRLDTYIGIVKYRIKYQEYTGTVAAQKQRQSIVPNIIHGMDASHLMFTREMLPDDVELVAVHDSFGCHVADIETLNTTLRKAFHKLYTEYDIIKLLKESLGIEEDPPIGNLDIKGVLDAEYFFH